MSWSPSQAASLPSLRPGQSSPATPFRPKSKPLDSLPYQLVDNAASLAQQGSAPGNWGPVNSQPPSMLKEGQQHKAAGQSPVMKESPNMPIESPRHPNQHKQGSANHKSHPSSGTTPDKPSAKTVTSTNRVSPTNDNVSFFRLTNEELYLFRRKKRKGPTYTAFSDFSIAQELNRLGRGWKGYSRASRKAEEEGRLDEFRRGVQNEYALISTGRPLPVGTISIQAAADIAKGGHKAYPRQPNQFTNRAKANGSRKLNTATTSAADQVDKVRHESTSERPAPGSKSAPLEFSTTQLHQFPSKSPTKHQRPEAMASAGADFQTSQEGRPKDAENRIIALSHAVGRPRPRRVEERPDYRIRRIRERGPNMPPRAPSPSPRDLYNSIQPRFTQFCCEWTGCKAVLNNAANLRKHVGIVHGQEARETLSCGWGKCGRYETTGVLNAHRSVEELEEHIEGRHMESMKWHLGDGRVGRGLVSLKPGVGDTSYLFRDGRQVTPSTKNQKVETPAEWRVRKERLRAMLLEAALNAPTDTEDFGGR